MAQKNDSRIKFTAGMERFLMNSVRKTRVNHIVRAMMTIVANVVCVSVIISTHFPFKKSQNF
jgi:t-SNARE complex subunit (syntaxin)